ncbi:hypothetical protein [Streptomyces olivaceus]
MPGSQPVLLRPPPGADSASSQRRVDRFDGAKLLGPVDAASLAPSFPEIRPGAMQLPDETAL